MSSGVFCCQRLLSMILEAQDRMQECLAVEFTLQVLQGWDLSCYQFCSLNGLLLSLVKKKNNNIILLTGQSSFPVDTYQRLSCFLTKATKLQMLTNPCCSTSAKYSAPGNHGTRLMLVNEVALGNIKVGEIRFAFAFVKLSFAGTKPNFRTYDRTIDHLPRCLFRWKR